MRITIPDAVRQMLAIVEQLCAEYPKKKFTLDGRLVGDIGEVLVEDAYDLVLFEDLQKHHDAQTGDGRLVQIKATMKKSLTFPGGHVPKYYLGVQLHPDGTFTEIFNGPGAIAWEAVRGRALPKTNLHSVSIGALRKLQTKVEATDRIPLRLATRQKEPVQIARGSACLCCDRRTPVSGPRVCPECGHAFRGNGWDGVDAHWRANHDGRLPYASFWKGMCREHRRGSRANVARREG